VKTSATKFDLELEVPFAISRDTTSIRPICVAEVEFKGIRGYGEASPSNYYGDSIAKAEEAIIKAGDIIGDDPFALEAISERLSRHLGASPSGRAAVEVAVYDVVGKITGLPVYRLLGLSGMEPPRTSLTVGVEDVELARRQLAKLRGYPILKAKLGFGDEYGLLSLLKAETGAILRADANEGWEVDEAIEKIQSYGREFSIEFFEQPLPKEDVEGYRRLRAATDANIIVDETVTCAEDIMSLAGLVDGINIKIMKCGGLREALRMISVARAAGLGVMLGCMVESSLGITAAAHIAPLVDYCDLDGNLLITNDPFQGVKAVGGLLRLPDLPGLGVTPK
jgi:L-alanine-DL-glutamate epimerase-like enolase superfamily enzyme